MIWVALDLNWVVITGPNLDTHLLIHNCHAVTERFYPCIQFLESHLSRETPKLLPEYHFTESESVLKFSLSLNSCF